MFMLAGDTEDGKKHWFVNFRPWDLKLAFESFNIRRQKRHFQVGMVVMKGGLGRGRRLRGKPKRTLMSMCR